MFKKTDVVYIAGPMTGQPLFNYPKFYGYAELIQKEWGCKVLNPARQPNGLKYSEYLKRAMEDVNAASVVVLLDGWENSNGAMKEFDAAYRRGCSFVAEGELFAALDEKLKKENANV